MKIISDTKSVWFEIERLKAEGKKLGFVPTMGALHQGHLELVEHSVRENDFTVVSIFVNPTQFNNLEDLKKYPRNLDRDAKMLEKVGCNLIFAPQAEDIYSVYELNNVFEFNFHGLDKVMEGKFRPGHFNGVVQVVSKLFQLIAADNAYFGEKDFQQLAIIHLMIKELNFNVHVVDCPIVREASGLAMSSRNERLSTNERENASNIYKVLSESTQFLATKSPQELQNWVIDRLDKVSGLELEYFEIVNSTSLQPAQSWNEPTVGCVAVYCGRVRLIDNIRYRF
jgi:pantoate--beta-alanine ligase